jgi:hypothetical protein
MIDEITRPLPLPLERLRLLEQSMIMTMYCATITPASATEGSPAVFEFSLSNPSAVVQLYLYIHQWNCWSADYTTTSQTVTVPAGATTGTVSVTTADTIAEK